MTKSELINRLAERYSQLVAKDAEYAVKTILDAMTNALSTGQRIEIRGFGSFSISRRPPRMGRNPRTGEQVLIPEKLVPHFKPGKALREGVALLQDGVTGELTEGQKALLKRYPTTYKMNIYPGHRDFRYPDYVCERAMKNALNAKLVDDGMGIEGIGQIPFPIPKNGMELLWNHQLEEVLGNDSGVNGLRVKSTVDGTTQDIDVAGVFIAIGHKPNTAIFQNVLNMEDSGYLLTRDGSTYTDIEGIFACGDVQDHTYRQAITAAGSGCMAALDCERWLEHQH